MEKCNQNSHCWKKKSCTQRFKITGMRNGLRRGPGSGGGGKESPCRMSEFHVGVRNANVARLFLGNHYVPCGFQEIATFFREPLPTYR